METGSGSIMFTTSLALDNLGLPESCSRQIHSYNVLRSCCMKGVCAPAVSIAIFSILCQFSQQVSGNHALRHAQHGRRRNLRLLRPTNIVRLTSALRRPVPLLSLLGHQRYHGRCVSRGASLVGGRRAHGVGVTTQS